MLSFECAITTCDNLRLGVIVNIVFLFLTCALLVLLIIANAPQQFIRGKIRREVAAQLVHSGYSLYLGAGSAFFGALTFAEDKIRYLLFFQSWGGILLLLLLIECLRVRYKLTPPKGKWNISRVIAIFAGLAFTYWVWIGGQLPLVNL